MTAKAAKLDPRRSRKLTSRECSSVLGGYLGGMATSNLIGVAKAREGLKIWVECPEIWKCLRFQADRSAKDTAAAVEESRSLQADGADPALRSFWRGLGSVIGGLRVLSSERAVKTAVTWLFQEDSFWPKEVADG